MELGRSKVRRPAGVVYRELSDVAGDVEPVRYLCGSLLRVETSARCG